MAQIREVTQEKLKTQYRELRVIHDSLKYQELGSVRTAINMALDSLLVKVQDPRYGQAVSRLNDEDYGKYAQVFEMLVLSLKDGLTRGETAWVNCNIPSQAYAPFFNYGPLRFFNELFGITPRRNYNPNSESYQYRMRRFHKDAIQMLQDTNNIASSSILLFVVLGQPELAVAAGTIALTTGAILAIIKLAEGMKNKNRAEAYDAFNDGTILIAGLLVPVLKTGAVNKILSVKIGEKMVALNVNNARPANIIRRIKSSFPDAVDGKLDDMIVHEIEAALDTLNGATNNATED